VEESEFESRKFQEKKIVSRREEEENQKNKNINEKREEDSLQKILQFAACLQ
jgi:hypothetical protein